MVFSPGLGLLLESHWVLYFTSAPCFQARDYLSWAFPASPTTTGFVLFEVRIARVLLRLCPIRLERTTPRHSRSQVFLPPTSLGALPGREGLLRERQRLPWL